jgi:hypothetical protein
MTARRVRLVPFAFLVVLSATLVAQDPPAGPPDGPPGGGFGGPPGGFPGGPGGPGGAERKLVEQFDADKSGRLETEERAKARAFLKENPTRGPGGRGGRGGPPGGGPGGGFPGGGRGFPGGFPGGPGGEETAAAEEKPPVLKGLKPEDAPTFPGKDLYDPTVLRTIFLEFPNEDWFDELSDFHKTDVEVPAKLTVDRKAYPNVGVHFRGSSSFMMVRGKKKSLGVALDFADKEQNLYGYENLNLLNANDDPSFLREVLFSMIARDYEAAPKVNLVRVVVNGENWGVYVNAQQTDKLYLQERFGTKQGVRWKVGPNFAGDAALVFHGDDVEKYKGLYTLKSSPKDEAAAWKALIDVCRALKETPVETAAETLPKMLDVHGALWFLAIDNVLMDADGYYSRGSDYELWLDPQGVLHTLTRDNNETFGYGGGPGGPGGMRGGGRGGRRGPRPEGGAPTGGEGGRPEGPPNGPPEGGRPEGPPNGPPAGGGEQPRGPQDPQGGARNRMLDPLAQTNETTRPLVGKLLSVPAWRARYLAYVRTILNEQLDWAVLGPKAKTLAKLIDAEVKRDDKSLYGYKAFQNSVEPAEGARPGRTPALKTFVEERRASLLASPALQGPWPAWSQATHVEQPSDGGRVLSVRARAAKDVPIVRAVLWSRAGAHGAFVAAPMFDDGKHDDGAANDGVFGASTPPLKGKEAAYYVEGFTANDEKAAYVPARADAGPTVVRAK